ncbi:hypothetical protein L1887_27925 [Cichorium endivia]|nr:hypothetical protein L1887_27925 [Cichorium endivia]
MKAYKLMDVETNEVFVSRDVIFYEDIFSFMHLELKDQVDPFQEFVTPSVFDDLVFDTTDTSTSQHVTSRAEQLSLQPENSDHTVHSTRPIQTRRPPSYLKYYHHNLANNVQINKSAKLLLYPLSQVLSYDKLSPTYRAFSIAISTDCEPKTYNEVAKSPERVKVMQEELIALEINNTWSVVPLPRGRKALGSKWVYKIKRKSNGTIERLKARLVAKGFNKLEGIDFLDTYSIVAKLVTIKLLFALAAQRSWPLLQLDVNNAFLNGYLDEEVYMQLPQGYTCPSGYNGPTTSSTLVCKL